MKGLRKILSAVLCTACLSTMAVASAGAADEMLYGTMNIPYDKFYENEGISFAVDAVSSATTAGKWKNTNLVNGTYNQENGDGTGTILGVTYNVALTQETLNALGDNNYNFTPTQGVPEAYKVVTTDADGVDFSTVTGASTEVTGVTSSLSTATAWGDYLITVDAINNGNGTSDLGTIYGVVLTTQNGKSYGLRHLENIWRDQLAWSSGITTSEPHGNQLQYENYVDLMGQTINTITYITESGYHTLATDLYVPVKFNNTLEVVNNSVDANSTIFTTNGFPSEYQQTYSVNGLDCTIANGVISYSNATPGQYTLTVSDSQGVYANVTANFVLSTDKTPASFDGEKIVKAEGFSDSDFSTYMKNISTVKVGDNAYNASGKRSVKIINEDGTINMEAASGETPIFAEAGTYDITVTATGYENDLKFTLVVGENEQPTDAPSNEPQGTEPVTDNATNVATSAATDVPTDISTNVTNATNATGATNAAGTTTGNSTTSGKVVDTGDASQVIVMLALLIMAGFGVSVILKKKVTE